MSKVVVTEFMGIDGVIESPEKWSFAYWNSRIEAFKDQELAASGAQLLGRKTYDTFAEAWPGRTGYYADRLNAIEKYVVSASLGEVTWRNTRIIPGGETLRQDLDAIKQRHPGGLLVHGSHLLVQSLIQQNLVDEYHLLVFPLAVGAGRRLFGEGAMAHFVLEKSTELGSGVVLLIYHRSKTELDD